MGAYLSGEEGAMEGEGIMAGEEGAEGAMAAEEEAMLAEGGEWGEEEAEIEAQIQEEEANIQAEETETSQKYLDFLKSQNEEYEYTNNIDNRVEIKNTIKSAKIDEWANRQQGKIYGRPNEDLFELDEENSLVLKAGNKRIPMETATGEFKDLNTLEREIGPGGASFIRRELNASEYESVALESETQVLDELDEEISELEEQIVMKKRAIRKSTNPEEKEALKNELNELEEKLAKIPLTKRIGRILKGELTVDKVIGAFVLVASGVLGFVGKGAKNVVTNLGGFLAKKAKQLKKALPGLIGTVASKVLSGAGSALGYVSENLTLMVIFISGLLLVAAKKIIDSKPKKV